MWNSRGGVKKRYPEKPGIIPIIDMLKKGKVKLLTNDSLSGIIFQLTVDEADSEYMDVLDGKFVVPVTDYVLKIACISKTPLRWGYYIFGEMNKKIELEDDFLNEARLQQKIWMESISGGRPALCPSIVDVLLFDKDSTTIVGGAGSDPESISEPMTPDTSDWSTYDSKVVNELVNTLVGEVEEVFTINVKHNSKNYQIIYRHWCHSYGLTYG
jgi:hypothetical protein